MPLPILKAVTGHPGVATDPKGRYWVRIKLGTKSHRELRNNLKDALERRDSLRVDHRRRVAIPGHRDFVLPGKTKLVDYIDRMQTKQEDDLETSTMRRYGVSEKALLRIMGQGVYLHRITPRVVENFRKKRRREVEPASVNRDLTRLNAILRLAAKEKYIHQVPFEYREVKFREPEGRLRVLSDEEQDNLMFHTEPLGMLLFQFALLTGFRLNEQLKLTWNQVHETRIQLHGPGTKTHRRRSIPMNDKIREILDEQRGQNRKWVFPNRGGKNHWSEQNLYRDIWNPARDRAGLVNFKWHDFRHTFCSRLVERGANIVAVKELAGHRSIEVTMRYVHLAPEHLQSTMDLL